jgi:hypothetical protein
MARLLSFHRCIDGIQSGWRARWCKWLLCLIIYSIILLRFDSVFMDFTPLWISWMGPEGG